jgi:hypothetical protein
MPEGGAGVVGCVGADIDKSRFSKPLHIGPTRVGTSVLVQTEVEDPLECRRRATSRAFIGIAL